MTNTEEYKILTENFPFLSVIQYGGKSEYVGIIQNVDINVTSLYAYHLLHTDAHKKRFIELGNEWWWETNRQIPINIILGKAFEPFKFCLMNFSNKDLQILCGPSVSLRDLLQKKSKKRNIQLIRKVPPIIL